MEPLLGRPLTPDDGSQVEPPLRLPEALAKFYATIGELEEVTSVHDSLYPPERLEVRHGMLTFMEENQGVVLWGIREEDLDADDPEVFQAPNDGDLLDWRSQEMPLSYWLELMCCWQLYCGGMKYAVAGCDSDALAKLAGLPERFSHPDGALAFFGEGPVLICLLGGSDVWVGSSSRQALDAVIEKLDISLVPI